MAQQIGGSLAGRRLEAIRPARDERLDLAQLGAQAEIGDEARPDDDEVDLVHLATLRPDEDGAVARCEGAPGAAGVQPESGVRARAPQGVRRRKLTHANDLPDKAPFVDVGKVAEVAQKSDELRPAVGVDVDQAGTAESRG